jgi:hypothetical protein
MSSGRSRHRHDQRTWQDRNASLYAAWTTQMPILVSAYLSSKSDVPVDSMDVDRSTLGQHVFQIDIFGLRGKYGPGYLYLNILPQLMSWLQNVNTANKFPRIQMKKPTSHSFVAVSLELLQPNLQLHLRWKLWNFIINFVAAKEI